MVQPELDIKWRLVRFAQAMGVQTKLQVKEVSCKGNPDWSQLERESGERTRWEIDKDYMIESLDDLLRLPNIELSRLVWRTMCDLDRHDRQYLTARYQKNRRGPQTADCQLVHWLRKAKWIPQITDSDIYLFRLPADASKDRLPDGFQFDKGSEWLTFVHFGENKRQRIRASSAKTGTVRELGICDMSRYIG